MAQIKIWVKFAPGATNEEKDAFIAMAPGTDWMVGTSRFGSVTTAARQVFGPDEGVLIALEIASLDAFRWSKNLVGTGVLAG